jgi:predicted dehydrogenase
MVRVGIVGIGFMGMIHYLSYQRVRGVKVVALCEMDKKRLAGDWRGIKGNFGPVGTQMDLSGIDTYSDWRELVEDDSLDYVDVCLPPAMHADVTIGALKAGRNVFCEKPISLTTTSADRMVRTAEREQCRLMIGHVLPFFPEYAWALKVIESGKYGRLLGGHFKRVISDPKWLPRFYDPDAVGGPMLDLHIHDAHFIRLVCGMPSAVTSSGRMRGDVVEYAESQFRFDDSDMTVTSATGVINQQGREFTHAFEIHLEKATLLYDFAVIGGEPRLLMPATLLQANGKVTEPKLGSGDPLDAFIAELTEVARSIRTGEPSEKLGGQLARDALVICQKETQSVVKGRPARI